MFYMDVKNGLALIVRAVTLFRAKSATKYCNQQEHPAE